MSNFFEELKKYFEATPQDKVLEDWAKSEEFDKIGPTVEEFLRSTQMYDRIHSSDIKSLGELSFVVIIWLQKLDKLDALSHFIGLFFAILFAKSKSRCAIYKLQK